MLASYAWFLTIIHATLPPLFPPPPFQSPPNYLFNAKIFLINVEKSWEVEVEYIKAASQRKP